MGVKGLWQLLEPAGRPITLERLEGMRLAVDVSIWLHKAAKGMRDKFGNPVHNGHLLMMFQRICKLLFYKIKPIFVFDGGVPELKKRTLMLRKDRKLDAHLKAGKTREKMLQNYVQSMALGVMTGKRSAEKATKEKEPDLFALPALPSGSISDSSSEELEYVQREKDVAEDILSGQILEHLQSVDDIDINSEDFKQLPPEVQHELLVELKESHRRKYNRKKYEKMPEKADDFSSYQLAGLLRRGQITKQIDDVRKTMSSKSSGEVMEMCGEETGNKQREVEARRVVSEPKSHYILIKSTPNQGGNTMFAGVSEKHEEKVEEEEREREQFQKLERTPHQFKEMYLDEVTTTVFISESSDEGGLVSPQRLTDFDFRTPASVTRGSSGPSEYRSDTATHTEDRFDVQHDIGSTEILVPGSTCVLENRKCEEALVQGIPVVDAKKKNKVNVETTEEMADVAIYHVAPSDLIAASTEHKKATCLQGGTDDNALLIGTAPLTMSVQSEPVKFPTAEEGTSKTSTTGISDVIDLTKDGNDIMGVKADVCISDYNLSQSVNILKSNVQDTDTEVKADNQGPSSALLTDEDRKRIEEFQRSVEGKSKDDISEMQDDLEKERRELDKERQKLTRAATSVVDEMYNDVQELLRLFGIPFLISPMEAEAQCAALDSAGLTEGSITDDSDIFLFGGRRVYKNIFNQNKYAEFYSSKDIETMLFLDRHKMIALAYLTGSDYTEGIHGVGGVTAIEILQEFPGEPADTLQRIREWFINLDRGGATTQETKIKTKMRNMTLPPGFPNPQVFEAYISPVVDSSDEPFEWGSPDLGAIRDFARDKLNWRVTQTDEVLLPVLQRLNAPESQSKLTSFYPSLSKPPKKQSKRIQRVLDLIRSKTESNEADNAAIPEESLARLGRKRKKYETETANPGKGRQGKDARTPINDELTGNPCQGTSRDFHCNDTADSMDSGRNPQSRISVDLLRGFTRRRIGRGKSKGGASRLSLIKKQAAAITKLRSQPIIRKQLQPVARVALSSSSDSD